MIAMQEEEEKVITSASSSTISSDDAASQKDSGESSSSGAKDASIGLIEAIVKGETERVKDLLTKRLVLSARDNEEQTPLMVACRHGHLEIVKVILTVFKDQLDVNEQTTPTKNPVHDDPNYQRLIQMLKRARQPVPSNARKISGRTALILACGFGGNVEIVRLLLEHGADINLNTGSTALASACLGGKEDVVKLLLSRGADVALLPSNTKNSPLFLASMVGHANIVSMLLGYGADPNTKSVVSGHTPLSVAVCKQREEIAELLLKHGADPNCVVNSNRSVLFFALFKGDAYLQNMLLENGAEPSIRLLLFSSLLLSDFASTKRLWEHRIWNYKSSRNISRSADADADADDEDEISISPQKTLGKISTSKE